MKDRYRYIIFVLCLLVGGVLLGYPMISNWLYTEQSYVKIQAYEKEISSKNQQELENILTQAQQYNESLMKAKTVLTDPFLSENIDSNMEIDGSILDINASGQIGYIEIPCIDLELPIYEGTEEETLKKGIGHLEGSSIPVGGKNTHTVLAGHTGMDYARMFTDLDELEENDIFYLNVLNQKLVYRVISIMVVLPEDTDALRIIEDKDLCTLVTCTPYGVNTHRLLVTGERISEGKGADNMASADVSSGERKFLLNGGKCVIWIVVVIAGILLYFAPWIRTAIFRIDSTKKITAVTEENEELTDNVDVAEEWYQFLSVYNQKLVSGGQEQMFGGHEVEKLGLLCDSWEKNGYGIIEIPRMNVRMPLFLGDTDTHLASGAAVMEGTSVPLGEDRVSSNTVIAGHRGYRGIPFFRDIELLQTGDVIYLTTPWGTFTYRVESTKIVSPDALEELKIQDGKDMVTLLTCHPYMSQGTERYLVYCVRSDEFKDSTESVSTDENTTDTAGIETDDFSSKLIFYEKIGRVAGSCLLAIFAWRCIWKKRKERIL